MLDNLKAVGLNEDWLKNNLDKQNIKSKEDITLATVDTDNNLSVYIKTKNVIKTTCID